MRGFLVLGILAILPSSGAVAAEKKPALSFTQDGNDLVVTTELTINNSVHALGTSVDGAKTDKVVLHAYVVQNSDILVRGDDQSRSQRKIKVEWRLPDTKKDDKE